jgi:hypothetical protein
VKHFCIGWDVRILHDWWRANGEGMRAMLADATAPANRTVSVGASPAKESVGTY